MNDANAASAPGMLRRIGSLLTPETIAILTVGMALGTLMLTATDRIGSGLDKALADRHAFQAEAAADRRAFQAEMDEFRKRMDEYRADMQRLGERQGHLEGQREGAADR